jgi:hypothetical protein
VSEILSKPMIYGEMIRLPPSVQLVARPALESPIGVYTPMRNVDGNCRLSIMPTQETYAQLQQAYEWFNDRLFQGALPNCLITLQRHKGTYGYFSADRFSRRDGSHTDEIALNPEHFRHRGVTNILSTLAHEIVHLWQHHYGKPGRGRYHNHHRASSQR